jgi:hypothetical protein
MILGMTKFSDLIHRPIFLQENNEHLLYNARFEIFHGVDYEHAVFWNVKPCDSCKNRIFGGYVVPIMKVTGISELGTTLALTSNGSMLWRHISVLMLRHCIRNKPFVLEVNI